jgi:predicted short-subunit dehydrogenase-like oxidoreductase (DUF2520 family)
VKIRIIGRGRAGASLAGALTGLATVESYGRDYPIDIASGADLVVLAVPDHELARCAARIAVGEAVLVHLSGATTLAVLSPHRRVASLHPLVSMPDPIEGARRLRGAWMAVAGDPLINEVADLLDGRILRVDDSQRALYHATAAIAANHLVALMGQVERLAALIGVPARAFLDLAAGALASTIEAGAAAALTGPVSRGDWGTVRQHVAAIPNADRALYLALVNEAARLAGSDLPADLAR